MEPSRFLIIGSGFRAQCFLHVARELPQHFRVTGVVVHRPDSVSPSLKDYHVPVFGSLDDALSAEAPDFVVVIVPPAVCETYLYTLFMKGIPALAETPPATDLSGLLRLYDWVRQGARIQVAEQYQFRPMNQARMAVVASGRLGTITEVSASISHGYHGMSLIRKFLNVGYQSPSIRAMRFESPVVSGPTRSGPPTSESMRVTKRDIAWLDFGDKLGIYDFTTDQHRSWIQSTHLSIRGTQGEIFDSRANLLADFRTPVHLELRRINRGEEENVEGYFLSGILLGTEYVYQNPYAPSRLNDDEIAVATSLSHMREYVRGGIEFYGVGEAAQDHYLSMLVEQAISSGETVVAKKQSWGE